MTCKLEELMGNPGLEHISDKIIEYLGPEDVAECRLVSKFWRDYIDSHKHWYILQLEEIGREFDMQHDVWEPSEDFHGSLDNARHLYEWMNFIYDFTEKNNNVSDVKVFATNMMEYYIEMQKQYFTDETPLHWAIPRQRIEFMKLLPLNLWTIQNEGSEYWDDTAFHKVCEIGNKEVVEWVLNLAQDHPGENEHVQNLFFSKNEIDLTAFQTACLHDRGEIVELLVEFALMKGVSIIGNAPDDLTPLHLATKPYMFRIGARSPCPEGNALKVLLKFLNQLNLDLFARDNYNYTAFELACHNVRIEVVEVFLEYFKINDIKVNSHGMQPLIKACRNNVDAESKLKIVQMLAKSFKVDNLDTLTVDESGKSALHFACKYGPTELVNLLLENGFTEAMNARDNSGKTPLDYVKNQNKDGQLIKEQLLQAIQDFKASS